MYHLFKWLIGRLGRRTAPVSREPVAVSAPGGHTVRPPGDDLVSPQKAAVPGAGQDAAALSVRNLGKRFGDRVAFADVCFDVGYGEVFGFLGPNGAGKTTTVRTLATLLVPTSGSATVAGIPLAPENGVEIRRRISVMPESPGLYLRLSVAENLECFAGLYQVPGARDRIGGVLRAVGLADRAGDACGSLSKGLRQRVALARAQSARGTLHTADYLLVS
jgi:ABC-2 type transport system ATP-binding protein